MTRVKTSRIKTTQYCIQTWIRFVKDGSESRSGSETEPISWFHIWMEQNLKVSDSFQFQTQFCFQKGSGSRPCWRGEQGPYWVDIRMAIELGWTTRVGHVGQQPAARPRMLTGLAGASSTARPSTALRHGHCTGS